KSTGFFKSMYARIAEAHVVTKNQAKKNYKEGLSYMAEAGSRSSFCGIFKRNPPGEKIVKGVNGNG
ncbi:MAG: hypothetical protein K5985_05535, partial [Lachnospiraceae bacterium]|nr:hypothetical protein [Lachnospiraceae bacterium]